MLAPNERRAVLLAGPLLGLICASACWLFLTAPRQARHSGGPGGMPPDFTSPARASQVSALLHRPIAGFSVSEQDLGLLRAVLAGDGPKARTVTMFAFHSVHDPGQQRRVVQVVKSQIADTQMQPPIYSLLSAYARSPGRTAVQDLTGDRDGRIAAFAKDVLRQVPEAGSRAIGGR